MIPIHADLLAILDAVTIESAMRYSVLGELLEVREGIAANPGRANELPRRVASLAGDLYDRLYLRPSASALTQPDWLAQRDLVAALSAANTGRGHWESGWRHRRITEEGQIVVARDGIEYWTPAAGVRIQDGPADPCLVRVPKEQRGLLTGFYLAIGDAEMDVDPTGDGPIPLVRYYWHLKPSAAVPFLALATSFLNANRIPFRLKVLSHPRAYHRADAGVLYLHRRDPRRVDPVIGQVRTLVASGLRPSVPMFTLPLAEGLGFAEDPPGGLSFGQHRCQLVAGALWESFARGQVDRDARAATLASAFLREGLDPRRPHRGPGSRDPEPPPASGTVFTPVGSVPARGMSLAGWTPSLVRSFLEVAVRLGEALCRSAYWDRDGRLCNWMGRSTAEVSERDGPITPTSAALGPDLYGGSAGVALFLAQLHSLSGADSFRRTALGGIDRSIRRLDRSPPVPPLSSLSFFSGDLGVAYAARRIGDLVEEPRLFARAEPILDRVIEAASSPHLLDVIGGNAGAIPILLALSQEPGLGRCRELAIALGEELCRAGLGRPVVHPAKGAGTEPPGSVPAIPSGMSHGAAGIGLALFELSAGTGRLDFREAARRAFEYEDALLDPQQGNWAYLPGPAGSARFEQTWCNGAPGIALTRLRAAVLDPERTEDYLATARIGIATALTAIDQRLLTPRCDATPCHGLAGLIEIVWIAGLMTDNPSSRDRALAAARSLIDRHAEAGDWPSGLYSGGPNPSLMLGDAGIGYTFLRLHDPEGVPSILLLTPESNAAQPRGIPAI